MRACKLGNARFARKLAQHTVPHCTRSAHDATYGIDFLKLSAPSIMGATANSFPFAAAVLSAAFMGLI